jgi:hypothetical protein
LGVPALALLTNALLITALSVLLFNTRSPSMVPAD